MRIVTNLVVAVTTLFVPMSVAFCLHYLHEAGYEFLSFSLTVAGIWLLQILLLRSKAVETRAGAVQETLIACATPPTSIDEARKRRKGKVLRG